MQTVCIYLNYTSMNEELGKNRYNQYRRFNYFPLFILSVFNAISLIVISFQSHTSTGNISSFSD